jgi:hypothetical protein
VSAKPKPTAASGRIGVTIFEDKHGKTARSTEPLTLAEIERVIKTAPARKEKESLRLLKLATFGDKWKTKGGKKTSLRHDGNVTAVTGIEGDYDGEEIPMAEAADLLRDTGLAALLYTSASHTPTKPRYRILVPLTAPLVGKGVERRRHWAGVLNAILGGVLSRESFTLSQAYYFGPIAGRPAPEVIRLPGLAIDELPEPPDPAFATNGVEAGTPADPTTDAELRAAFDRGDGRYQAMVKLSARWAARGMAVDDIENALTKLCEESRTPCNADGLDLRTRARPLAETAVRKFGETRTDAAAVTIDLKAGEAARALADLAAAMPAVCEAEELMVYGGRVTHPYAVERPGFHGRTVEVLALNVLSVRAYASHVDNRIAFYQWKEKKDGPEKVRTDCPDRLVATFVDRADLVARIPVQVRGLSMTPVWRDGELVSAPGYDPVSRMWITAPAIELPKNASRAVAVEALDYLKGWLREFSFADDRSAAAAVGLLISAAMRASLPHTPMFIVNKHEHGEGGSTLCTLATVVQTGREPAVITVNADDGNAEIEKRIDAAQLAGEATLCLDNWKSGGVVNLTSLATIVSETERKVRIFGKLQNVTCPNSQLVLVNGRNIGVADDFIRRSVEIALDTKLATPETRKFDRPEIVADAVRDRAEILKAAFTIVAAYSAAGQRAKVTRRAGFNEWVSAIAAALGWLGLPDISAVPEELRTADQELGFLARLLAAWEPMCAALGAPQGVTASQVIAGKLDSGTFKTMREVGEVQTVLGEATGAKVFDGTPQLQPKQIGYFLRRVTGRRVGNRRLITTGSTHGATRWRVERLR